jgi:hypothetical protein
LQHVPLGQLVHRKIYTRVRCVENKDAHNLSILKIGILNFVRMPLAGKGSGDLDAGF